MKSFFFVCTIVFVLFSFNGVISQTCPKVGLLYGIQSSGSTHTVSLLDFKCKNITTVTSYTGIANDPFLSWTFDAANNRLYISHFTSGARTVIYSVSTNGGSATTNYQYTTSPIPRISNLEFDSSSPTRIFALVTANSGQIRFSSFITTSMSTENIHFNFPNGYTALFSSIDVTNRRYYAMVQRQSDSYRFAYVFDITLPISTTSYAPLKILDFGSLGSAPLTFYSFHADPADASFIYGLAKNASAAVYGLATLTIDTKAMSLIGTIPQPKVTSNVGVATFDRFKNVHGILTNNSDGYVNAYNTQCKDSFNFGTFLSILSNPNLESVCLDPVTTKAMTTGVTTGITTGQTTGRTTGITSGITTGRTTGITTGITTGRTTGITTGITTGRTTGITSGAMTTGDTTGQTTGITTGITTGETTGITTGETTGITTGDPSDVSTGVTTEIVSTGLTSSDITSGITSGVTSMGVSTGLTTQGATDNLEDQDSERNARNKKIIIIVFSVAGGLLVLVIVGVAIAIGVKKLSAPAAV